MSDAAKKRSGELVLYERSEAARVSLPVPGRGTSAEDSESSTRAFLLRHRRRYILRAKLAEREARTQGSFAELEAPVLTVRYWTCRHTQRELEAEARRWRTFVEAIDDLLTVFATGELPVRYRGRPAGRDATGGSEPGKEVLNGLQKHEPNAST